MFLLHTAGLFLIIAARYFLVAGGAYFAVWVIGRGAFESRRIQPAAPLRETRRAEIRYSLMSSAVFAVIGAMVFAAWESGHTRLYSDLARHGWAYWLLTLPALLLLHDTYFYWTHRLMHRPRFFNRVHRAHHESKNPTPWAAFSFHPWEALVEAAIFPLLVFTIPIHLGAFFVFLGIMTVLSVVNHLGYELYPAGFATHPVGKWVISATHHDLHHRKVGGNYGLYFSLWDRLRGTECPGYPEAFARTHARRELSLPAA